MQQVDAVVEMEQAIQAEAEAEHALIDARAHVRICELRLRGQLAGERFYGTEMPHSPALAEPTKTIDELPDGHYLTVTEIMEVLQVSRKTVNRWINEGELVVTSLGTKARRVKKNDLVRFLKEHEEGGY
jgi:excisionase family DNA binding protein